MSGSNELRSLLADTVTRLFTNLATKELIESAERGVWPDKLWRALEEGGLTLPLVPEAGGGAGGTWLDAHVVVRAAGRHTVPVPLAETIVASGLLAGAGLDVPLGPLTLAPVHGGESLTLTRAGGGWRLRGVATRVPWGAAAGHVVVLADADGRTMIALVPGDTKRVTADRNLALEPRDTLTFDDAPVLAAAPAAVDLGADAITLYGALVRSAQMAGAIESLLQQSVRYTTERKQFGRPISNFQAIQHQLAVLAGHAAAAGIAAERAFAAADAEPMDASHDRGAPRLRRGASERLGGVGGHVGAPHSENLGFHVAVAKIRAGEAAGLAAGIAHQVHGAIGFTYEHSLHFATRRLWSWRAEFGGEHHWADELGRRVTARGADSLWADLTAR